MNFSGLVVFAVVGVVSSSYSAKEVKCLVCKVAISEMTQKIEKVSPNKKIQLGGYRLGDDGEYSGKFVNYKRSSMHISELMDTICQTMVGYVRAKTKDTGKLVLIKLMTEEGVMNPEVSNVDLIQDSDLNKSLEFYCESLMEEFEDEIYLGLKVETDDPENEICNQIEVCEAPKDEL